MYMGWCDGVQACDHNVAHVMYRMPRAETLVVWTGSLSAPRTQITGLRTETCQYNRNTRSPSNMMLPGFFNLASG